MFGNSRQPLAQDSPELAYTRGAEAVRTICGQVPGTLLWDFTVMSWLHEPAGNVTGNMFVKENMWHAIFLDLRRVWCRLAEFYLARIVDPAEHRNGLSFMVGCAQVRIRV